MSATSIEWTQRVWNPTTGCDRVSAGCDHCYALTMAKRLKGMGSEKYQTDGDPRTSGPGFGIAEQASALDAPLRWRKPQRVFVNSMSDLFHQGVSDEFIAEVFGVMAVASGPFSGPRSPRIPMGTFRMFPDGPEHEASLPAADHGPHTFQLLTKRHGRMRSLLNSRDFRLAVSRAAYRHAIDRRTAGALADGIEFGPLWPLPNVWLGVSVEDQQRADLRIPALLDTPAAVRFLSCEPLLGPVDLEVLDAFGWDRPTAIDWVIVGGESGPGARPMHPDWAHDLRDQCTAVDVPFFFKQWGEWRPLAGNECAIAGDDWPAGTSGQMSRRVGKKVAGRELDGRTWDQFPEEVSS